MAIKGALHNARIAKTTLAEVEGHVEFEVANEETEKIKGSDLVPLCMTLFQIGDRFVLDATPLEEFCSDARLTVAMTQSGRICGIQKNDTGALEPSMVKEMMSVVLSYAPQLFSTVDAALLNQDVRIQSKIKSVGFY